jgi:ADP-heptose:LPS heptosyltransferase
VSAAYLDALIGRTEKASKVALRLVQSPYLLPNRRELPALCQRLIYILAAGNHLREYRLVLWTGVSLLQSSYALRDTFSAQIAKTYRGTLRALIASDVPLKFRIPYLLSNLARFMSTVPIFRWLGLDKPVRWGNLALLFIFEWFFIRKNELFREANRLALGNTLPPKPKLYERLKSKLFERRAPRVLVTRAMGGIGDILMMTPGLRALSKKYPNAQIDFAIPKSFHSILERLPNVRLLDIDEDAINLHDYKRWINLTDCPAGRVENRQSPNVRRNRIEIFAKAMGIYKRRLINSVGLLPFYQTRNDELDWARVYLNQLNPNGRPVIGVQPYAADTYRNWPYMEQLVSELAKNYFVLVFHHEPTQGFEYESVEKVVQPLRKSIALASVCTKLIVLDSSFLHFSAALKVPTIAIIGAISGRLRTKSYPNVQLLAPRKKEFPCYPCWRHEHKPCHLTNGRESICLRSISVDNVISKLKKTEGNLPQLDFIGQRIVDWVRFGRE